MHGDLHSIFGSHYSVSASSRMQATSQHTSALISLQCMASSVSL